MPTLDGKLWTASAAGYTGSFRVTAASHQMGSVTAIGLGITIACGTGGSAGLYSQTLLAGDYIVQIPGFPQFRITMPSGSGEYALEEVDNDESSPLSSARVYDDAAALAAVTVPSTVEWVTLREDSDTPPSQHVLFFRSEHANVLAFTPDGVNVAADASDNRFLRQGVDPDNFA
jgi:hypothetical protein